MPVDISAMHFDARHDRTGVWMQQGRLLLDADWNEFQQIIDRRLRAQAVDFGSPGPKPGVTPGLIVPRTGPGAFSLAPLVGGTDLSIGPGRGYVNGVLAENHGRDPAAISVDVDPILGDPLGDTTTNYLTQPWLPDPPALPTTGTHVVYLDTWQREVTHIEEPELVEPAVNVDTTARVQTIWQVRIHPQDTPGVDCGTPDALIPGWEDATSASGARLTTGVMPVIVDDSPCALSPSRAFRGLENLTFRVQVHDPGSISTATFKWSRENASVVVPVLEVPGPALLRPESFGHDDQIGSGKWVEIIDDRRELNGLPGELRLVERAGDLLDTNTPLPADLVMTAADAQSRHLRVILWDQTGVVRSETGAKVVDLDEPLATGAVPVGVIPIQLENGVTVSFSTAATGGDFHTGDYWCFTARVASGDIERLTAAPPRAIRHHYARLGVLSPALAAPDTYRDCRVLWPPESGCGCTVCVTEESHASGTLTIQDAVDLIPPGGGTVCLHAGTYRLSAAVSIVRRRSIRVHGHTPGVLIVAERDAVTIGESAFVTVCDLSITALRARSAITLRNTVDVSLERLSVAVGGEVPDIRKAASAITISGVSLRTHVVENELLGGVGIRGGVDASVLTADLTIRDLVIAAMAGGIVFDDAAAHLLGTRIESNTIISSGEAGIHARGVVDDTGGSVIQHNTVRCAGDGIRVGSGGYDVHGNHVSGSTTTDGVGIAVDTSSFASVAGTTTLVGNRVDDPFFAGIAVRGAVARLRVADNTVRGARSHGVDVATKLPDVEVRGNTVDSVSGDGVELPAEGIRVTAAAHARISGNTVTRVGGKAPGGASGTRGISVVDCTEARVSDNLVEAIGLDGNDSASIGISVAGSFARLRVDHNIVRRTDGDDSVAELQAMPRWTGIQIGDPKDSPLIVNGIWSNFTLIKEGSLVIGPKFVGLIAAIRDHSVAVTENQATGGVRSTACSIHAPRAGATIALNRFASDTSTAFPQLVVRADSAQLNANTVRGGDNTDGSIAVNTPVARVAVVGNLTNNGVTVEGQPLAAVWAPLNPVI